jgi:hypothetical protein
VTDVLKNDGSLEFDQLVTVLQRVTSEPACYLEIKYAGLVVRVYPSKALPGKKPVERMKHFASFMIAMSQEVENAPISFALAWRTGDFEMGIMREDGLYTWMPAEITEFNRLTIDDPVTASFPWLDEHGQPVRPLEAFRRIRL